MRAVVDTSALNYLVLLGKAQLLPKLFSRVFVPGAVATELSDSLAPAEVRAWINNPPAWLEFSICSVNRRVRRFGLEAGETEVLSAALDIRDSVAILDDWAARQAAGELQVSVVGLLGILVEANRKGYLDLRKAFEALSQTSFRVRPSLLREILDAETR